jgi:hypothetical protein
MQSLLAVLSQVITSNFKTSVVLTAVVSKRKLALVF